MHKLFLVYLLFISCSAKNKNTVDKIGAQKLYKEAMPLYESYFSLQIRNHDSAKTIRKILIEKFKEIYKVDSTDKKIGGYLAECYFDDKNYENAIYWCNRQISYHKNDADNVFSFETLAQSYINLGRFDSGKVYVKRAINNDRIESNSNNLTPVFLLNIKAFIDNIINKNDAEGIALLQSKNISPCQYVVGIFNFIFPYAEKSTEDVRIQFEEDDIPLSCSDSKDR
jgi:tetratricopeptide (TPR) repeat protein